MKSHHRWLGHVFIALLSSTLIGCGGSSSSSSSSGLSGTAATGVAINGGIVSARCADGSGFSETVTSGSDGKWTGTLSHASALPCALEVSYGTPTKTLHSYAQSLGTVNITPLTDMAVALAANGDPATWFANFDGTPVANLDSTATTLLAALDAQGFAVPSNNADPFTTAFNADHTGLDQVLDQLQQALSTASSDYQSLLSTIISNGTEGLDTSLPSAPPQFNITGTVSGAAQSLSWNLSVNGSVYNSGYAANGSNTFSPAGGISQGSAYQLNFKSPDGQDCQTTNLSGNITADINITITCIDKPGSNTYAISGTISGATAGQNVIWELWINGSFYNDGGAPNGTATFSQIAGISTGSTYQLIINSSPANQNCTVNNATGTVATANISNIAINCVDNSGSSPSSLYDFSTLNLKPQVPAGMTPGAPSVTAIDPSSQISNLFTQLANQEKAAIFAAKPAGTEQVIQLNSDIYTVNEILYNEAKTQAIWYRQTQMGFGADGQPNTSDDVVRAYTIYPHGNLSVGYSFTHPGADNQWFTSDDIGSTSTDNIIFPTGALLEYQGASEGAVLIIPCLKAGDDRIAYTSDDAPCSASTGYQIAVIDGQGNRGQVITYTGKGTDQKWFTADDTVKNYTLVSFEHGTGVSSVIYNGAGTDGVWFTSDDVVQMHTLSKLSDEYKPLYTATYNAKGTDNQWFTPDDVISAWTYYGYDANGNVAIIASYTGKGTDGVWFTSDDSASAVVSIKDDAGREIIAATISSGYSYPPPPAMGADGQWLTADDNVSQYTYKRYDDAGRQTDNATFNNAGSDGKWFSSDDLPYTYDYWQKQYDAQGNMVFYVIYNPTLAPDAAAFSDATVEEYRVYNYSVDPAISLYIYRSQNNFGADNTPFTADDRIANAYQKTISPTLINLYNQAGVDGEWFTADDVLAGHIDITLNGSLETQRKTFDAQGNITACSQVVDASANPYRVNSYNGDCGTGTLTGYQTIALDDNGYAIETLSYNALGEITYRIHNVYVGNGKLISTSTGIASYDYIIEYTYNSQGEPISYTRRFAKNDGVLYSDDDEVALTILKLSDSVEHFGSTNTGYLAPNCGQLAGDAATGSIQIKVLDQNQQPLADVTAMLDQNGTTVTTDANGEASFSSLTGTHDVHLFKNGYGWESFYCTAPGDNITLHSKLPSLSEAANSSAVYVNLPNVSNSNVMLRLLDNDGKVLNILPKYTAFGDYGSNACCVKMDFNLPVGSQVTGTLWVLKTGSNQELVDAIALPAQSYTTTATNDSSQKADLSSVSFDATPPAVVRVATAGTVQTPLAGGNSQTNSFLELGQGLIPLSPTVYLSSEPFGSYAVVPDTALPSTSASGLFVLSNDFLYSARLVGNYPDIYSGTFAMDNFTSLVQLAPGVSTQDGSGTLPVVQWSAMRMLSDASSYASVTTVELAYSYNPAGWQSAWTIHAPAGETSVQLPSPPAAITDPVLPNSNYVLRLNSQVMPDIANYFELIGSQNLHHLDYISVETLQSSTDYFDAKAKLQR